MMMKIAQLNVLVLFSFMTVQAIDLYPGHRCHYGFFTAEEEFKSITSPNYPRPYGYSNCLWLIYAERPLHFELEGYEGSYNCSDTLLSIQFDSGQKTHFCGTSGKREISENVEQVNTHDTTVRSRAKVRFYAKTNTAGYKGFKLRVKTLEYSGNSTDGGIEEYLIWLIGPPIFAVPLVIFLICCIEKLKKIKQQRKTRRRIQLRNRLEQNFGTGNGNSTTTSLSIDDPDWYSLPPSDPAEPGAARDNPLTITRDFDVNNSATSPTTRHSVDPDESQARPTYEAINSTHPSPTYEPVNSPQPPPTYEAVNSPQPPPTYEAVNSPQPPPTYEPVNSPQPPPTYEAVSSPHPPPTYEAVNSPHPPPTYEAVSSPHPPPTYEAVNSPPPPPTYEPVNSPQLPPTYEAVNSPQPPPTYEAVNSPHPPPTYEAVHSPHPPPTYEAVNSPPPPRVGPSIEAPQAPSTSEPLHQRPPAPTYEVATLQVSSEENVYVRRGLSVNQQERSERSGPS